ncbi:acylaminoacyl-peptidase [Brumimicrobium salinarum]|uniref:Acylaminoacyl-peptidase n=1 Tax=Brumimicrobium salinarum TaxID=2058658 RepID=A0A2I0R6V6_9FLAO|nr:prolyl oligopeptidase family serine peptidase [Brumimicrobium salinarum]PKR82321.1 acylaminoacyl-peptidase [Brumimicrobium salinarum]
MVQNFISGDTIELKNVTKYGINQLGTHLYYVTHQKINDADTYKMNMFNLTKDINFQFETSFTAIENVKFSKKGKQLAFISSTDTIKETRKFKLYLWSINKATPQELVSEKIESQEQKLTLSPKAKLEFSLDETKLFFGLREMPVEEEEDTLLKSEKAKLDIWHYQNKRLQPQQLKELKKDQNASFLSVFHLAENKLTQLENDTLKVRLIDQGNADFALASSNESYAHRYNWTYPWPSDYYRVDISSGNKQLIKSKVNYSEGLSPDGAYFIYFLSDENAYYAVDIENQNTFCITCDAEESINWKQDINGMPFKAHSFGSPGYITPSTIVLYAEHHIYQYDLINKKLSLLSNSTNEINQQEFVFRIKRLEKDSTYIDLNNSLVTGVNQETMDESIFKFINKKEQPTLRAVYSSNHKILGIQKAKNDAHLIFRQMNVKDYPDVYLTNTSFEQPKKISNANPQQENYIWPTVEQVTWTAYDSTKLKGLLYKPENFDTTKSYPLMVYFYELYSDKKHYHYIPKPTASIIYATEYTSAGYVVFIPDIRYTPGEPAQSAYNSIMSGTDKVLELYPNIDSTRMGLQGQSWGGYQTAQLITMTDRYAAAMAGAPVSNMFSAYGGIRWGSGLNRAFQYERTQSRIGKTIWEAPELYVKNSPLFGVPHIETPLLIMHNDNDGAVPWYQGIEMFTAMKRLNKPVWMLNYNGDKHNLMQNANRMDLSIRMRQFFDHFLQGKPAPEWLIKGVPAIEKGKNYGLGNYE